MKLVLRVFGVLTLFLFISIPGSYSEENKTGSATAVGLYSETEDAPHVEFRTGKGKWIIIKLGDKIPGNAEIRISVDRDWVELTPSGNPNAVYEINGSEKGVITKKLSDVFSERPKRVSFPVKGGKEEAAFKNKLVVKRYLGRQHYKANDDADSVDIRYGDKLDKDGVVNIIAINNTLTLVYPNGVETNVIGPIRFKVEKLFTGQSLYKYLNVTK